MRKDSFPPLMNRAARRRLNRAKAESVIEFSDWYATSEITERNGVQCRTWKRKAKRKASDHHMGHSAAEYWEVKWIPVGDQPSE